ncbi:MAG: BON domain-containing protein [Neisseria sp.]|nr:BON domain-containing protein [Neisseria sp.]
MKSLRWGIITLMLSLSLSGCALLAIGGATVGGLALAERRTVGAQTDDQIMELAVKNQIDGYLKKTPDAANTGVSVVSYNRNILLMGAVPSEEERLTAERIARTQQAVRHVYNYITVGAGRSADQIARDGWTTSKIRTMMLKPRGFSPNHVKVVTHNGVTYVMGILTAEEQAAATQEVSTTSGVQKVVTLYETFTLAPQQ